MKRLNSQEFGGAIVDHRTELVAHVGLGPSRPSCNLELEPRDAEGPCDSRLVTVQHDKWDHREEVTLQGREAPIVMAALRDLTKLEALSDRGKDAWEGGHRVPTLLAGPGSERMESFVELTVETSKGLSLDAAGPSVGRYVSGDE
jgi:hypothetical protein